MSIQNITPLPKTIPSQENFDELSPIELVSMIIRGFYTSANPGPEYYEAIFNAGIDVDCPLDECGNRMLHFAALVGNLELTKMLIAKGASLNIRSSDGRTALEYAYIEGHYEVFKELITSGAISRP